MTDRERLVELIEKTFAVQYAARGLLTAQHTADHLLANGVVVPLCKVGDKTFLLLEDLFDGWEVVESYCCEIVEKGRWKTYSMVVDCPAIGNTLEFYTGDFGRTVFLTKEEAEQVLKEFK